MLKIRLQRVGRKHDPSYRVVLVDSRRGPKSGNFLKILGHYDPRKKDKTELNGEAINAWIGKGAQTSGTMNNLLVREGVIKGGKRNVIHAERIKRKKKKPEKEEKEDSKDASEDPDAPAVADEVKVEKEDKS